MLTLHSFLRQTDSLTAGYKKISGVRIAAAASLLIIGVATAHTDISYTMAKEKTVETGTPIKGTIGEEESDTKAKVQNGFENLALSLDMLSKNLVSENLDVNSEKLEETKEVISLKVKEKANETVKEANLLSQDDYSVLLRIVEAEAGGEDLQGKVLVANVVMNRVYSNYFPNTVREVVYERVQFSPVGDGRINTVTISDDTVTAVGLALGGEDYSQGAFYFSARDKADASSMRWFDANLKWLFKHGGHEFYTFR